MLSTETIKNQNWRQLSSIQIGGVICLPVIMIGQTLSQTYGLLSAIIAILIGNALLLLGGLIMAKMSHERGKTTPENSRDFFGEKGVTFFALVMVMALIGWFAIQLNMMSLGALELLSYDTSNSSLVILLNVSLGTLITLITLRGLHAITLLANLSLPLLIGTLAYALYSLDLTPLEFSKKLSFNGTSMVIAMAIAVVIDLPTYFRHSRSARDGYISIFIIFALAVPALEIMGVYLANGISEGTILDVLKRVDNQIWNTWVALFLILAGWTTNNLNLYSGVICMESVFANLSLSTRTLAFGFISTLLSCLNLLSHLELALDVMGIFISSMGAVVLTRYLIVKIQGTRLSSQDQKMHLIAWTLGIVSGICSLRGFSLVNIPVLDAMIAACGGTFLIAHFRVPHEKIKFG